MVVEMSKQLVIQREQLDI